MRACRVSFHVPPPRSIATMAADTTACWRHSALRIALIGPPASGKGGRSEPSQLLARTVVTARCSDCRVSPTAWVNDRGTMPRWVGVPRAVSFYGLLSGPPSDPPVNISRPVEFPSLGQHALPPSNRSKRTGTTAHGSGHSRLALRADFQV